MKEFKPPSIAAGGIDALVFRALEVVSLTLLVIVTGRLMEPAGRGLYALASLTLSLTLLPLGAVWVANVVEMAARRVGLRELAGGSLVIAGAGGVLTGLGALAVAPLLGERWWVVALPAAVTPFTLLVKYQEGLFMGLGHVRAVNLVRLARALVPLAFITPPLLGGASPRTAIAAWALSFVMLPLLVHFPLRSLAGGPKLPRDRGYYKRVIAYGGRISALNAVDTLNDKIGLLALAAFATNAAVGVFSIAVAATQVLLLATQALALSAFRRIGSEAPEASAALTARAIRHAVLLTGAGSVLLVPLAFVGVPWTVGPGYEDVPLLVALLVPNAIGVAVLTPLYTYFQVQTRRPVTLIVVGACALVANVGLALALVPRWDIWGAALAASLGVALGGVVAVRAFGSASGVRLRDLLPARRELEDYAGLVASLRRRPRSATGANGSGDGA